MSIKISKGHLRVITGLLLAVCKHLLVLTTVPKELFKGLLAETEEVNGEQWP